MNKINFTQIEYNRAREINGNQYTVITRPTKEGKIRVSAVWLNNGKLVAKWATKDVTYMYQVNDVIVKLTNDVMSKHNLIKYEQFNKHRRKR